jgi:hypothetical protein
MEEALVESPLQETAGLLEIMDSNLPRGINPLICSLYPVLRLRRLHRLPLHVGRRVGAAAFEGGDVVDHVAGAGSGAFAGRRAGVGALELPPGRRAALDAAVRVALAAGALDRAIGPRLGGADARGTVGAFGTAGPAARARSTATTGGGGKREQSGKHDGGHQHQFSAHGVL